MVHFHQMMMMVYIGIKGPAPSNLGLLWYNNKKIITYGSTEKYKIQEINNNYGYFELYYGSGTAYIKINGLSLPLLDGEYYLPRFIRTDYEVRIGIGHDHYKYEDDKSIRIMQEVNQLNNNFPVYNTYDIDYQWNGYHIILIKNDKKLGVVNIGKFKGGEFTLGIGPNYFIVGTDTNTYFWDFNNYDFMFIIFSK